MRMIVAFVFALTGLGSTQGAINSYNAMPRWVFQRPPSPAVVPQPPVPPYVFDAGWISCTNQMGLIVSLRVKERKEAALLSSLSRPTPAETVRSKYLSQLLAAQDARLVELARMKQDIETRYALKAK